MLLHQSDFRISLFDCWEKCSCWIIDEKQKRFYLGVGWNIFLVLILVDILGFSHIVDAGAVYSTVLIAIVVIVVVVVVVVVAAAVDPEFADAKG